LARQLPRQSSPQWLDEKIRGDADFFRLHVTKDFFSTLLDLRRYRSASGLGIPF
jgi:hypothetical protein